MNPATKLKITTKVVTFTTVKAKTFWERLEALQSEFKGETKVDYSNVSQDDSEEDTEGENDCGFLFETIGTELPKNFEARVIKAFTKADTKVANDAIKDEQTAKAFEMPVLDAATNKYAIAAEKHVKGQIEEAKNYMKEKDYYMARCLFADVDDLVKLFNLLNKNRFETARKFVSHLDTSVRECIPEVIYRHLNDEEIDK